jgi:hypothetical protein
MSKACAEARASLPTTALSRPSRCDDSPWRTLHRFHIRPLAGPIAAGETIPLGRPGSYRVIDVLPIMDADAPYAGALRVELRGAQSWNSGEGHDVIGES